MQPDWTHIDSSLHNCQHYIGDLTLTLGWNSRGTDAICISELDNGNLLMNVWNNQIVESVKTRLIEFYHLAEFEATGKPGKVA